MAHEQTAAAWELHAEVQEQVGNISEAIRGNGVGIRADEDVLARALIRVENLTDTVNRRNATEELTHEEYGDLQRMRDFLLKLQMELGEATRTKIKTKKKCSLSALAAMCKRGAPEPTSGPQSMNPRASNGISCGVRAAHVAHRPNLTRIRFGPKWRT